MGGRTACGRCPCPSLTTRARLPRVPRSSPSTTEELGVPWPSHRTHRSTFTTPRRPATGRVTWVTISSTTPPARPWQIGSGVALSWCALPWPWRSSVVGQKVTILGGGQSLPAHRAHSRATSPRRRFRLLRHSRPWPAPALAVVGRAADTPSTPVRCWSEDAAAPRSSPR